MCVESLEFRFLPTAMHLVEAPQAHDAHPAFRATLKRSAIPKSLTVNLVGTYRGSYVLSNNSTVFSGASLTVIQQTARTFSGEINIAFFGSNVVRFKAQLMPYRRKGILGPGYYTTIRYNTPEAHFLLRAAIVPGYDSLEPYSGKTELAFSVTGRHREWILPLTRADNSSADFWPEV